MSKGTKERHQRPGGSLVWPSFLSETLLRTSFKSEGSVQFTQQSQSPHQALNQQTVSFFSTANDEPRSCCRKWHEGIPSIWIFALVLTSSKTSIHVIPYLGIIPLIISTQKIEVVNSPIHWLFLYAPYFFLWSRLTQEPPGWNGNPFQPLPPMSPSPTLSMPSPWRFFVVTVRRWER